MKYTNATLNDDLPFNDTSYNTSMLTNGREKKITLLTLSELKEDTDYTVELLMHNYQSQPQNIQLSSIGKHARMSGSTLRQIPAGRSIVQVKLHSNSDRGKEYVATTRRAV